MIWPTSLGHAGPATRCEACTDSTTARSSSQRSIALPPYFISYSRKKRCNEIHLTEGCWRTPGMYIQDYEYLNKSVQDLWDHWESSSFCEDCKFERDGEEEALLVKMGLLSEPAPVPDDEAGAAPQTTSSAPSSSTSTVSCDSFEDRKKSVVAMIKEAQFKMKIRKRLKLQRGIK